MKTPILKSQDWDGQVQELLSQICPSESTGIVVRKIVRTCREALKELIPEAEITGFAYGDASRCCTYGVAVPEIDILLRCSPEVLFRRLQVAGSLDYDEEDMTRKLQKKALRACAPLLVASAGLRIEHRRTAFRGINSTEPKLVLLAQGLSGEMVPFRFSVNNTTPLYNATLTSAVSALDPRVLELGLLVKRWAQDRGICHADKGHLPHYAWNLMTIFFLQIGGSAELQAEPLLPPLKNFQMKDSPDLVESSVSWIPGHKGDDQWVIPKCSASLKAPTLLKHFFRFYRERINWDREAVSVRRGTRGPLPKGVEPHKVAFTYLQEEYAPKYEGSEVTALAIVDPFESTMNLATFLDNRGLARMKQELNRADELCKTSGSLAVLIQPWSPPIPEKPHKKDKNGKMLEEDDDCDDENGVKSHDDDKDEDKAGTTSPEKKSTEFKKLAGDWMCPKCGDYNFARNETCRKCHTPKAPKCMHLKHLQKH